MHMMHGNYCEQMGMHDKSLNRKPVTKPANETAMGAHLQASLPAKYVPTPTSFPYKLLPTAALHLGTELAHWHPCDDHKCIVASTDNLERASQSALMGQLRVFDITDLVEKCGMAIKNVFVRSYAITSDTLPCSSEDVFPLRTSSELHNLRRVVPPTLKSLSTCCRQIPCLR